MDRQIKQRSSMLILPAIVGILFCASPSLAQVVTASARITIIVIPPSGIDFASPISLGNIFRLDRYNDHGLTFRTSSNVDVVLDSLGGRITLNIKNVGKGTTKTFTSRNLSGVSKVEAIFLCN